MGYSDGIWTGWYKNGQKKEVEVTLKDGEEMSKMMWYQDGSIKEVTMKKIITRTR